MMKIVNALGIQPSEFFKDLDNPKKKKSKAA
jgi:hypothetical protein